MLTRSLRSAKGAARATDAVVRNTLAPRSVLPGLRIGLAFLAAGASGLLGQSAQTGHVLAVRHWSLGDVTRIAIETDGKLDFHSDRLQNPDRLFFDIAGTRLPSGYKGLQRIPVDDHFVKQIRIAEPQKSTTRVVLDLESPVEFTTTRLENPWRLIIEVHKVGYARNPVGPKAPVGAASATETASKIAAPKPEPQKTVALPAAANPMPAALPMAAAPAPATVMANVQPLNPPSPPAPEMPPPPSVNQAGLALLARPTVTPLRMPRDMPPDAPAVEAKRDSEGDRSLTRVLGLKVGRIVIDPGHGGSDAGTIGPNGLKEKDLVLDISRRLGALLEEHLRSEVVYARSDDSFVSLERRTQIANEAKADLFISIHANSSPEHVASGVETYYLSFTTSKAAMEVAARENATSQRSVFELQDLLQKIALKDKVDESREFATRVEDALYASSAKITNSKVRDRGVKKAPFVVLIGASMPSILAEIGFISNPHDEALMMRPETRQKIAEALYKGVASYAGTLSHFQVAQRQ